VSAVTTSEHRFARTRGYNARVRNPWSAAIAAGACAFVVAVGSAAPSGQKDDAAWGGVLDEHPAIAYASRPTTDRVARLNQALASGVHSLERQPNTGYLAPLLEALGVPVESQLLVFSKTGVQRAYTGPHTPRAIFFDQSVVVAHVPGAPFLELAAQDPQQGVVFYTLDQTAAPPVLKRQTSCLTCHVSAATMNVPGMIVRSNTVDDGGNVMPQLGSYEVNHATPHPDRWGGWYVTSDPLSIPYAQRAHTGNITFTPGGSTSNQVFIDWLNSAPETRGYLSPQSDIVALLVFDHQMRAINLLTRLNWESRVAPGGAAASVSVPEVRALVNELADYLLFLTEQPPTVPLIARAGFAERLAPAAPKDSRGRSLAQLELTTRLLKYPCSYMVYSEAFDGLAAPVRQAVYERMMATLSSVDRRLGDARVSTEERRAVVEILRETKADFPR
jgi:hypothetical protein